MEVARGAAEIPFWTLALERASGTLNFNRDGQTQGRPAGRPAWRRLGAANNLWFCVANVRIEQRLHNVPLCHLAGQFQFVLARVYMAPSSGRQRARAPPLGAPS